MPISIGKTILYVLLLINISLCSARDTLNVALVNTSIYPPQKLPIIDYIAYRGISDSLGYELNLFQSYYNLDPQKFIHKSILNITPGVYAKNIKIINEYFYPLFSVLHKNYLLFPYYSCYLIANRNSSIQSIDDIDKVRGVYYVNENSVSGYTMPLHFLWRERKIKAPSLKALHNINISTYEFKTQKGVLKGIADDCSGTILGFVGEIDTSSSLKPKILARFENIPQDVIFMSKDLIKDSLRITRWFEKLYELDTNGNLKDSIANQMHATTTDYQFFKITNFTEEQQLAYERLSKIKEEVDYYKDKPFAPMYKLWILLALSIATIFFGYAAGRSLFAIYVLGGGLYKKDLDAEEKQWLMKKIKASSRIYSILTILIFVELTRLTFEIFTPLEDAVKDGVAVILTILLSAIIEISKHQIKNVLKKSQNVLSIAENFINTVESSKRDT